MLRPGGNPISFKLKINSKLVIGRQHCIWGGEGNPDRSVNTAKFGDVNAYQTINLKLKDRPFCTKCWQWLVKIEPECPLCLAKGGVVGRARTVRGWIGLQRYLHENEFGIDILRHGRKIEVANKELFNWQDGDVTELEYPIDDPRGRGRIVGEIHLDHCRVSYTKDRFDRNDPAWEEMLAIVRGEGPLRPDKAADLGYTNNASPLFKLFQVFRRSTPKTRVAGCWAKLLVVPNNDRAIEMAARFQDKEPDFQPDSKWWELVDEADQALLVGGSPGSSSPTPAPAIPGFGQPAAAPSGVSPASAPPPSPPSSPVHASTPYPSLSGLYRSESTNLRWDVNAFHVAADHPELGGTDRPWTLKRLPNGEFEFFVNTDHQIFTSATMTPLDGILSQLAHHAADFLRAGSSQATFASILAELRERHAAATVLDLGQLATSARQTLAAIATTVAPHLAASDPNALFTALPTADRQAIQMKMATKGAGNTHTVIGQGRFLEYATPRAMLNFFEAQPELFLDGHCWDDVYGTLDFGNPTATEEAKRQATQKYSALLADAVWVAEQDAGGLAEHGRGRLLRAQLALDLLAPSASPTNE